MGAADEAGVVAGEVEGGLGHLIGLPPLLLDDGLLRGVDAEAGEVLDLPLSVGGLDEAGHTALQRMFWSRNSTAIARANMCQAPLVAL